MELTENTAINNMRRDGVVFVPADVRDAFGAEFLDKAYCHAWIMERLHGDQPCMRENNHFCPKCGAVIPVRLMHSFWTGKRVKCDECGKYFTALTGTFLSGCHFDFREIVLLAFMLSLGVADKQIAATLNISAENVRLWRHRFEAISQIKKITSEA